MPHCCNETAYAGVLYSSQDINVLPFIVLAIIGLIIWNWI
jgi:hypothetical protein